MSDNLEEMLERQKVAGAEAADKPDSAPLQEKQKTTELGLALKKAQELSATIDPDQPITKDRMAEIAKEYGAITAIADTSLKTATLDEQGRQEGPPPAGRPVRAVLGDHLDELESGNL